ncbi:MAG: GNAT family N-acetyltransferase [Clostridia bacterium]
MHFTFLPVNDQNIAMASQLHIAKAQVGMVETVAQCYSEAQELTQWRPTVICADGAMIGFAMYGLWKNEGESGRVWLDRFLIDEHYQGLGYAKAVLPLLVNRIIAEYGCTEIYLSVYSTNAVAIHLYEEFGFSFNGELDINGEKVMVRAEPLPL